MNSQPRATAPGIVHVTGRAAGSFPAWGRTQAPPRSSPSPSPGIVDAQCTVVSPANNNNAGICQPNIGFAVVGEGGAARILPFDANMMSTRNLMDSVSSSHSLHSESFTTPWNCNFCSYENADANSQACSVCGSVRTNRDEPSNPASRATVHVASVSSLQQENVAVEEPPIEPRMSRTNSSASADSSLSPSAPAPLRRSVRSSRTGRPSLKKNSSVRQALGTSFAIWSKNDKGPWTCPSCTYLNQDHLHLTCEVCGRIRSENQVENPASFDGDESSLTDYFNASIGSGQLLALENQERVVHDVQQGVMERERMYELMEEQARILAAMHADNSSRRCAEASHQACSDEQSGPKNASSQMEGTKLQLQQLREELENALESEKNQLEMVEQVQRQRRAEIEHDEGIVLGDHRLQDRAVTMNLPQSALDWMAQERLLEDWKSQRKVREEQLDDVRRQEERVLKMYKNTSS